MYRRAMVEHKGFGEPVEAELRRIVGRAAAERVLARQAGDIDDVRAHGKDERIGVKEFYTGVEFMYRFIKALSSEKNHNN